MVHVSITTPRSATFIATFIFSWSALTNLCSWGEIGSGECDHVRISPLPFLHVLTAASQIQPAPVLIFMCLTFNLLRSRSDVP
ncbi:hypothetical protein K438DRAFT_1873787, partial [Mycena galopus ATCC 62051]